MMMNCSQIPALVKTQEVQLERHLFRCQTSALLNTTSFLCKSAKLQKWGSMQAYKLDWLTCHSLQARKVGTLVSWATENLSTESFVPSKWRDSVSCHGVLYATAHLTARFAIPQITARLPGQLKLCLFAIVFFWVWSTMSCDFTGVMVWFATIDMHWLHPVRREWRDVQNWSS